MTHSTDTTPPQNESWFNPLDKRFKWTPTRLKEVAKSLNEWVDKSIITQENFLLGDWCFATGFLPCYFHRYVERSPELGEAYQRAKAWQSHCIARGALFNKLNSRFATMWLANHHKDEGWTVFQNSTPQHETLPAQIEEINANMKRAYELLDKKV